jgi:hypothetical protein
MQSRVEPEIIKLLALGVALDKYAAAEKAHCHHRTAQRILRAAHQLKLCHVSSWATIYNARIAVYSGGKGKDAKRPPPIPSAERRKKRRTKAEVRAAEAKAKRIKRLAAKGIPLIPPFPTHLLNKRIKVA